MSDLRDALLEAHVEFTVDSLTGPVLPALIEVLLEVILQQADQITLAEAVDAATIKATARTYATEIELKGGIPELVGEVARWLHEHPIHDQTRVGDLMSDRRLESLVDHALEFRSLRSRIVGALIASPLYETFASDLLYNGIRGYLTGGFRAARTRGGRGAAWLSETLSRRTTKELRSSVEERIKGYIASSVRVISEQTTDPIVDGAHDEALRELIVDSWQRIKDTRLGELRADVTADNVEDVFVTGYEWWQELRRTELVATMIDAAVDAFYDKYSDVSLKELVFDLGITREIMRAEAMRFGPPVIRALHERGLVAPLVRSLLEPFYRSSALSDAIAARSDVEG